MSALRGVRVHLRGVVSALIAIALLTGAPSAHGSEASEIVKKCAHSKPFGGYRQKAYREALKQLPTEVIEYSPCFNEISKDALAAGKGGGGATAAEASSSNVPLPLTASEQRAVQRAHRGSTPIQVGGEPIRPGVVHANIASAVNTLPHSLFAVLAFMLAGAAVLAIGEVRERVRSRRHG